MKRLLLITAAAGILTFSAACTAAPSGEEYFPIAEGMLWDYELEFNLPFSGVETGESVIRVEGTEEIEGKRYLKVVNVVTGLPGAEPEIIYFRKAPDGVFEIRGSRIEAGEYLSVPFPLELGSSWTVQTAGMNLSYSAEAVESVPLPDRSYEDCIKISFSGKVDGAQVKGEMYQARGIGMIRQVMRSDTFTIEYRLTEFKQ